MKKALEQERAAELVGLKTELDAVKEGFAVEAPGGDKEEPGGDNEEPGGDKEETIPTSWSVAI